MDLIPLLPPTQKLVVLSLSANVITNELTHAFATDAKCPPLLRQSCSAAYQDKGFMRYIKHSLGEKPTMLPAGHVQSTSGKRLRRVITACIVDMQKEI